MPEGDTVYLSAKNLNTALAGSVLTGCDIRVPEFATFDLTGHTLREVVPRGKHLLMRVGGSTIHTHLKMEGSWHLYRPETPWRRPAWQARIILRTAEWVAVGFQLGITEVLRTADEHTVVGHLGPDLLGPDWDAAEAQRRLLEQPERPIGTALLDQRNLAGLGNVYRAEICFLRGVLPTRPVGDIPDLPALIDLSHRLITANRERSTRTTTGKLRGVHSWVYGRERKPCARCGTLIRAGTLGDPSEPERNTFWCPSCQT